MMPENNSIFDFISDYDSPFGNWLASPKIGSSNNGIIGSNKLSPQKTNSLRNAFYSKNHILLGKIYFRSREPDELLSKHSLNSEDLNFLRSIINDDYFDKVHYKIIGFSDSRADRFGNQNFNLELSFRRAFIVSKELFGEDLIIKMFKNGILNSQVSIESSGVDNEAEKGDNPYARRVEIWCKNFTSNKADESSKTDLLDNVKKYIQNERTKFQDVGSRVVYDLATSMVDVYKKGGDMNFVFIGIKAHSIVYGNEFSSRTVDIVSRSPIEQFYQGKNNLTSTFNTLSPSPRQRIYLILNSKGNQENIVSELAENFITFAQLMINGTYYHNLQRNMINMGRLTPGKWRELQSEIKRRTLLKEPPSIYYEAFDIDNYLDYTGTIR